MQIDDIVKQGKQIKLELFKKFALVQEGHPGSILSIFDIVNMMYLGGFVKVNSNTSDNDFFIMSKGHAGSVQYPYLVRAGLIPQKDWDEWPSKSSCLKIFPNRAIPGIDVTGGSLGHGLGIAAGMALSVASDPNDARNIFVIISEGELYEGSIWEALLFISHHKLNRIKIILDCNNNIILGNPNDCLSLGDLEAKFKSFGFNPTIINGHDPSEINEGLKLLTDEKKDQLDILIANTIKGYGVSFFEGRPESHYWVNLNEQMLAQMMDELSK